MEGAMPQPSSHLPHDNPDRPRGRRLRRAVNGDCSRARRFADPIRRRYYAAHRARRFARRMIGNVPAN
jgi:hypothetical protein